LSSLNKIWDKDYALCYNLRALNSEQINIQGLSALIYVNADVEDTLYNYYFLNNTKNSQVTGVRVLTHAPRTNPDMKLGIDMSTGLATTIVLEQTKHTRLPPPYTQYAPQNTLGPVDESTPYTQTY